MPERRTPKHPIRDSAIVYAGLAGVIVGFSLATGGSPGRAAVTAWYPRSVRYARRNSHIAGSSSTTMTVAFWAGDDPGAVTALLG